MCPTSKGTVLLHMYFGKILTDPGEMPLAGEHAEIHVLSASWSIYEYQLNCCFYRGEVVGPGAYKCAPRTIPDSERRNDEKEKANVRRCLNVPRLQPWMVRV